MSERTIAEIIGWRRVGDEPQLLASSSRGWQHADGRWLWATEPNCTVDDLLAWLLRAAETQDGVEFAAYWSTEAIDEWDVSVPPRAYSVHIGVSNDDGDMHTRIATGPTLLAALEAAVRAVDAPSSPQPEGCDT